MPLIAFALLALAACNAWAAQRIVMYRCTDASGAVMLQNDVPCPKGSKQEKRVVDAPPPAGPMPSPVPTLAAEPTMPTTPSATASSATATAPTSSPTALTTIVSAPSAAAERSPPPALYRCETYDKQRYFGETGNPESRCVPLQTVGLDGNPDTGVGRACEMVTDTCKRVADESLCTAWKLRLRDAESAVGFGNPQLAEASNTELDRIGKIVRESACSE